MRYTLLGALTLHVVVILGIGFTSLPSEVRLSPSLEVVILQTKANKTPDEADYLAQVASDGGGSSDDKQRPSALFTGTETVPTEGVASVPMIESAPVPSRIKHEALLTHIYSPLEIMQLDSRTEQAEPKAFRSHQRIDQTLEIAKLANEVNDTLERYAKRPKKKFVTARTKEAEAANYMFKWVNKVERLGNLNYPDQVRRSQLSGELVLSVGIKKDGTLAEILLKRSSGHRVLDDAAKRIVELAAPFDPLGSDLSTEADILYITRTWEFDNTRLTSRN